MLGNLAQPRPDTAGPRPGAGVGERVVQDSACQYSGGRSSSGSQIRAPTGPPCRRQRPAFPSAWVSACASSRVGRSCQIRTYHEHKKSSQPKVENPKNGSRGRGLGCRRSGSRSLAPRSLWVVAATLDPACLRACDDAACPIRRYLSRNYRSYDNPESRTGRWIRSPALPTRIGPIDRYVLDLRIREPRNDSRPRR